MKSTIKINNLKFVIFINIVFANIFSMESTDNKNPINNNDKNVQKNLYKKEESKPDDGQINPQNCGYNDYFVYHDNLSCILDNDFYDDNDSLKNNFSSFNGYSQNNNDYSFSSSSCFQIKNNFQIEKQKAIEKQQIEEQKKQKAIEDENDKKITQAVENEKKKEQEKRDKIKKNLDKKFFDMGVSDFDSL